MITEVRFNDFTTFAPTVTILKVTPKHGFYVVEHYAPRAVQTDLLQSETSLHNLTDDLKQPPRFTFDTDPVGCEKRACAWGGRGKK
jgi:hypothetical protein